MKLEVEDEVWFGNRRIWTLLGAPRTVGGIVTPTRRYVVEGLPGLVFTKIKRARIAASDAGPLPAREDAAA